MARDPHHAVPTGLPDDPQRLLRIAAGLLDGVVPYFTANVGAPGQVVKGPGDFATAVDLEIERRLGRDLLARTGGTDVHLSLSHDADLATAFVVVERREGVPA